MRILLLHPADAPSPFIARYKWDVIVDLGRAPASTYEGWSRTAGCRVFSIYDLNEGVDDLRCTRELLQFGMGEVVDEFGIDWWDVLAQPLVPDLQQLALVRRLAKIVAASAEIYSTSPHFVATALQLLTGGTLVEFQTGRNLFRRAKHYLNVFQQLDVRQFTQVLQDKFDPEHNLRRRFSRRKHRSAKPSVLLPSAYVNVSRTAAAYAAMVQDVNFLLVTGRNSGRIARLPSNVELESLNAYFSGVAQNELTSLLDRWTRLETKLKQIAPEFAIAGPAVLGNAADRLRWGVAIRNAWLRLYDSQNIAACLCADDTNPYSRIPLILARSRGLPAVACHHGALDNRMAIKTQHANVYLAKAEMEKEYLVRVCQVAPQQIVIGGPSSVKSNLLKSENRKSRNWLVFFTEPYHTTGWRTHEVYRDLLPELVSLARESRLELVFKVHPFESIKGHRRMLSQILSSAEARDIRIIAGSMSEALWAHVSCALTVQSSVAIDCAERGIPIFLCGWLADPVSGYAQQYARFGIGQLLQSPQDLGPVRGMLEKAERLPSSYQETIDPESLQSVLSGTRLRAALMTA